MILFDIYLNQVFEFFKFFNVINFCMFSSQQNTVFLLIILTKISKFTTSIFFSRNNNKNKSKKFEKLILFLNQPIGEDGKKLD